MFKKSAIIVGFGVAVWTFCGALVVVGRQFMSIDMTLIVHAVGAPIGAAIAAWFYFRKLLLHQATRHCGHLRWSLAYASCPDRRAIDREEFRHVFEFDRRLAARGIDFFCHLFDRKIHDA